MSNISARPAPISMSASIEQWLQHPVGGSLLREMLSASGRDEDALTPVRAFSLNRLVTLSEGLFTKEAIDALVSAANGGAAPAEDASLESEGWQERLVPGRFVGKTVIVTGAASGIGRATAVRIAREGGRVVAVDLSAERLAGLGRDCDTSLIISVVADITDPEGVARIVAAAGERIDGLANVAGVVDDMTPLHEVSDAVWERNFAVNVDGTFRLTRAVLPAMISAGAGSIVNVASEASLRGSAAGAAYTASKHAVVGLTKSAAYMYGPLGIRVNAVAPGPVATGMRPTFGSELGKQRIGVAMALLPAVAEPAQLAASITFLLSDDGTNLSGVVLPSDGGWSAA